MRIRIEHERAGLIEGARMSKVTSLHNLLVLASPRPSEIKEPPTIKRELQAISALTKDDGVRVSLGLVLTHCRGMEFATGIGDLRPVPQMIDNLREKLSEKWSHTPHIIEALAESVRILELQGRSDPRSFRLARELLTEFNETMSLFHPKAATEEELTKEIIKVKSRGVALKMEGTPGVSKRRRERAARRNTLRLITPPDLSKFDGLSSFLSKSGTESVVVDEAGLHLHPGLRIHKFAERQVFDRSDVVSVLGRDSATAMNIIPLEGEVTPQYALTLVVKKDGVWRRVHLDMPIKDDVFDSKKHLALQRAMVWTKDLPSEELPIAAVVEASPWYHDTEPKIVGESVKLNVPVDTAQQLIAFCERNNIPLDKLFTQDTHQGYLLVRRDVAQRVLDQAMEGKVDADQELLSQVVSGTRHGTEKITRHSLKYTVRIGVPGNEGLIPLGVSIDTLVRGSEVIHSYSKPGDPKRDRNASKDAKENEITDEERMQIADREAILRCLGIDPERSSRDVEIYFGDRIETDVEAEQSGGFLREVVTEQTTQKILTQPLARYESGVEKPTNQIRIQLAPYLFQRQLSKEFTKKSDIQTVHDLMLRASEGVGRPEIRIQSQELKDAYRKAVEDREEISILRVPQYIDVGVSHRSADLGLFKGSATYTGISFIGTEARKTGKRVIGKADATGAFQPVDILAVTTLPAIPKIQKRKSRRNQLIEV